MKVIESHYTYPAKTRPIIKRSHPFNQALFNDGLDSYIDQYYNSVKDILFAEAPSKENSFLDWKDSYANLKEIGLLPADWSDSSSVTDTRAYLLKSLQKRIPNDLSVAYLKSLSLLLDESEKSKSFIDVGWSLI